MRKPKSIAMLTELGRVRLSEHFFMRDFLYSEIAVMQGMQNIPDDPDLAIAVGERLCEDLLEPIIAAFGSIAIRSAYRSPEVNAFGNANNLGCASDEANYAAHIWDKRDADGNMGAMASIVVPAFWDQYSEEEGGWQRIAWWIHDTLPYSTLYFFPKRWAFNIGWLEEPVRRIDSYATPGGCLTKPGDANHGVSHREFWPAGV